MTLRLTQLIREEFEKTLSGPGISWNKAGMTLALERAISSALSRMLEEKS